MARKTAELAEMNLGDLIDELRETKQEALNDDKIAREAAMAVGETSGQAAEPRRVVSSQARRQETPEPETQPLLKEADPELEKLLDEEEDIARRTHDGHETPHFRGDD